MLRGNRKAVEHVVGENANAVKTNKALQHWQRFTAKFTRRKKSQFQPLLDDPVLLPTWKDSPAKLTGIFIVRPDGKFQLTRRYFAKASKGCLKFYKWREINGSLKDDLTPEYNMQLDSLDQILCNDVSKRFILCFPNGNYQLRPVEKDQYCRWKIALQQHRVYARNQKQRNEGSVKESVKTPKSVKEREMETAIEASENKIQFLLKDLDQAYQNCLKKGDFTEFGTKVYESINAFKVFVEANHKSQQRSNELLLNLIERQSKECKELLQVLETNTKVIVESCDESTLVPPPSPSECQEPEEVVECEPSESELKLHPAFEPIRNPRKSLPARECFGSAIPISAIFRQSYPVFAYQPLGKLQVLIEGLRYAAPCLNRLHKIAEPADRMCMVAAMVVSVCCVTIEKNRRPFSAILGETYDYISPDGWKAYAEQVQPQMSAVHASGERWEMYQSVVTKIEPTLSGTVKIVPHGSVKLKLDNGEEYSWNPVTVVCLNIRGEAEKRTVKTAGDMTITSSNGVKCKMTFYEDKDAVKGEVVQDGKMAYKLVGCVSKGLNRITKSNVQERLFEASKPDPDMFAFYRMNAVSMTMNQVEDHMKPYIPPTDTRLRKEIKDLEEGRLEHVEEAVKKRAETAQLRLQRYQPLWFQPQNDTTGKTFFLPNGRYWSSKMNKFDDPISKTWMLPIDMTK
ncbi:unnamed protein product [Bursaphelenchus okinawaensis]|uniref:PH domain-containing protein n=1 Tax=Bursaphelenchus okinawaensis TaxID=465554 RepID=A0A811L900_9BILA|nr:unnamed protein product [Bursaphelenchus okinawaensis]CAG9118335.1 unnamed protein product [Bursaphelenchus okinawaensis]